jgi:hypothetical protein
MNNKISVKNGGPRFQTVLLPKSLVRSLKRNAAAKGVSLQKYCVMLLEELMQNPASLSTLEREAVKRQFHLDLEGV